MKITINGNEEEIAYEMTINELLSFRKVESPEMISVEHNGVILERADFSRLTIHKDDVIEFLYFMGGGSRP
ncbi:MAG: sulfur carrier protein ThiS [Methanoregula sp.]|jgi:sulfur carrier protein